MYPLLHKVLDLFEVVFPEHVDLGDCDVDLLLDPFGPGVGVVEGWGVEIDGEVERVEVHGDAFGELLILGKFHVFLELEVLLDLLEVEEHAPYIVRLVVKDLYFFCKHGCHIVVTFSQLNEDWSVSLKAEGHCY